VLNVVQGFFGRQLKENGLIANIGIKSVAVWDTVGSLGIPFYAGDSRFDVYRFTDTALSAQVANGFHAMAIDEMRSDFPITRWDARAGVTQVWFIGAHADVGGGYARNESGLSDISLQWMTQKLTQAGVNFATPPTYVPATQNVDQPIHTPWKESPFNFLQHAVRQVEATGTFHRSVIARWQQDGNYRPDALSAFKPAGPTRSE
jgi:glutathione S-transferase